MYKTQEIHSLQQQLSNSARRNGETVARLQGKVREKDVLVTRLQAEVREERETVTKLQGERPDPSVRVLVM